MKIISCLSGIILRFLIIVVISAADSIEIFFSDTAYERLLKMCHARRSLKVEKYRYYMLDLQAGVGSSVGFLHLI